MRGLRSFLVLLVVAAGLIAYVYFVESKRTPGEPDAREKAFTIEASAIQRLDVTASSGDETTLAKQDDAWRIVEPVDTAADSAAVSEITGSLASLEIQRVVDEKPAYYAEYGLAPPRIEVAFAGADGAEHRLQLGGKTPTGGDMYARLAGQDRVFLVQAYLDSSFDRKPFDLRDKAVLTFTRSDVDRLTIESGGGAIRLEKSGADWRLKSPLDARAEYGTVESVIGRIDSGRMNAIAAEGAGLDLKAYGLDTPATTVTIGAGSASATLAIGRTTDDNTVYARDVSRPLVFVVDKGLADELGKTAADFRQRDQFEFRPFNATRIEFVRGERTDVFEKVEGEDGDTWRRTAPEEKDVDTTKMDAVLSAFSNLRAESFADSTRDAGLDRPAVVVSVRFGTADDQQTEKVVFGIAGDQAYAAPDGEPGAAKLDRASLDAALKALDEIQ